MRTEYDFSKGFRGKHAREYERGPVAVHLTDVGRMDYENLWDRLKTKVKAQTPTGKAPNEFYIFTVLQPIRNRIQVHDYHLMRLSEDSEQPQRITKDDIRFFAEQAVESDDHTYSIADPEIKPPRMGSIICSMLHLLDDEFEYRPKRILVYKGTSKANI